MSVVDVTIVVVIANNVNFTHLELLFFLHLIAIVDYVNGQRYAVNFSVVILPLTLMEIKICKYKIHKCMNAE